ncbi:MAG: exopolysaccharide biosynthesis polyprenyl glycosylphosphotransferase [Oscillospiraceae bacterium]|nr:exopolysaccharide biosynthesis polyprenyl glycosylphosphotransferase [Oscillospiraceae bacterium]
MYRSRGKGVFKHFDFIIIDAACMQLAFALVWLVLSVLGSRFVASSYLSTAFLLLVFQLVVALLFSSFKNVLKRGYYKEFISVVQECILVALCYMAYTSFAKTAEGYSRVAFFTTLLIYLALTYGGRLIWKQHLQRHIDNTDNQRLLVIATEDMLERMAEELIYTKNRMFRIVGIAVLDSDLRGRQYDGIPVVACSTDVLAYLHNGNADEVLINVSPSAVYPSELVQKIAEMGFVVHERIGLVRDMGGNGHSVEKMGSYFVVTTSIRNANPVGIFFKRVLDIIGGLAGCVVTALLYIVIKPIMMRESPGPVFFTQERVGRNGRKFKMYKFRTMYLDAEERKAELMAANRVEGGMMFKLDFDPRIIGNKMVDGKPQEGFFAKLRKYSLDEVPQVAVNVLRGDMSLVGTRPPTLDEWAKYDLHHHARLAAKPGVTGLWQVSGRSEITDFEEVVRLDTQYIREWTFGLDIKILLKTVLVVITRKGAM